ncbi:hypothetical protein CEXT_444691 [Caerostris extrusa]|uniref:Uncharacterized protein n=1 Tax=Caerostris extrusa TaxID=172846 RepID=A0AAV4ULM7_CAEEX|nr:hypothetical protein CEXT_444691 [Caerostris extrusa]
MAEDGYPNMSDLTLTARMSIRLLSVVAFFECGQGLCLRWWALAITPVCHKSFACVMSLLRTKSSFIAFGGQRCKSVVYLMRMCKAIVDRQRMLTMEPTMANHQSAVRKAFCTFSFYKYSQIAIQNAKVNNRYPVAIFALLIYKSLAKSFTI